MPRTNTDNFLKKIQSLFYLTNDTHTRSTQQVFKKYVFLLHTQGKYPESIQDLCIFITHTESTRQVFKNYVFLFDR